MSPTHTHTYTRTRAERGSWTRTRTRTHASVGEIGLINKWNALQIISNLQMAALATPLHMCSYIFIYALRGQRSPIYVKHLAHKHTKQNKQISTNCGLFDQQRQWERQRRRAYTAKFAVQTLFCPLLRLHCLFLEFVLVAVHERERIGVQMARERVVDRERGVERATADCDYSNVQQLWLVRRQ